MRPGNFWQQKSLCFLFQMKDNTRSWDFYFSLFPATLLSRSPPSLGLWTLGLNSEIFLSQRKKSSCLRTMCEYHSYYLHWPCLEVSPQKLITRGFLMVHWPAGYHCFTNLLSLNREIYKTKVWASSLLELEFSVCDLFCIFILHRLLLYWKSADWCN